MPEAEVSFAGVEPRRAYLGLGTNLGSRWFELERALDAICACFTNVRCSRVFETAPVGGPSGQRRYLNCVVALDVDISPVELLRFCEGLEHNASRVRGERWGPRTLDVDIVYIEGQTIDTDELVVPHPRWRQRAFVVVPMADVAPHLVGVEDISQFGAAARPPALQFVGEIVRERDVHEILGHEGATLADPCP